MNFTISSAVKGVGELLRTRILPEIGDDYAANMARMACSVLAISANWVDGAAELRVEENARLRALLGKAAPIVGGELAVRLAEAAGSADPGLKISVLDRENDRLRRLLVGAHGVIEGLAGEEARGLDAEIWGTLEAIEMARAPVE